MQLEQSDLIGKLFFAFVSVIRLYLKYLKFLVFICTRNCQVNGLPQYTLPTLLLFFWYSEVSGDREVQRTMLELLNQLDGFSSDDRIKVCVAHRFFSCHWEEGRCVFFFRLHQQYSSVECQMMTIVLGACRVG